MKGHNMITEKSDACRVIHFSILQVRFIAGAVFRNINRNLPVGLSNPCENIIEAVRIYVPIKVRFCKMRAHFFTIVDIIAL
ncbi:hypothetical protein D3C80_1472170 [compost metagenome]